WCASWQLTERQENVVVGGAGEGHVERYGIDVHHLGVDQILHPAVPDSAKILELSRGQTERRRKRNRNQQIVGSLVVVRHLETDALTEEAGIESDLGLSRPLRPKVRITRSTNHDTRDIGSADRNRLRVEECDGVSEIRLLSRSSICCAQSQRIEEIRLWEERFLVD